MKAQEKRIFISDLPEDATEADVENAFNSFGNVRSVEIKKRKELIKNSSLFFSYVNIEIDERNLQSCFKHFANNKWFGQKVVLQIARESFLDRLKREREENVKKDTAVQENTTTVVQHTVSNGTRKNAKRKFSENENCDADSSDHTGDGIRITKVSSIGNSDEINIDKSPSLNKDKELIKSANVEDTSDLIIKNNKGKIYQKHGLKIESVGNEPIIKIDKSRDKQTPNSSEANLKRLRSLNALKKNYQNQKSLIQTALSQIDICKKNKITFDDDVENVGKSNGNLSKKHLFDDDQSEDEINVDLTIKEQFQGKEGQKLLALQSRYKNDKRFILDSRFVDEEKQEEMDVNGNEDSLEEEKRMEYDILEKILGKDISKPKHLEESKSQKKAMLRFDPTQPEHSKFEMKREVEKQNKRKNNKLDEDSVNKKKEVEEDTPKVSMETFYKVTDNLKETLSEKQEFSLLSMFGQRDDKEDLEEELVTEQAQKIVIPNKFMAESNPFRYDSSDDEDETQNIPNEQEVFKKSTDNKYNETKSNKNTFWSEPFFFKHDDYRLQEGFDFIEKMTVDGQGEFSKLRRDLKEIVRAKVRNNQRRNKPFKKKLGGNKRKKMIRMKKALRR